MEIYAGAVDNVADNVGRLPEHLRDSNRFNDKLILFMSDNGAAGFFGWQSEAFVQRYNNADNSLENLGRDGSMPGTTTPGCAATIRMRTQRQSG